MTLSKRRFIGLLGLALTPGCVESDYGFRVASVGDSKFVSDVSVENNYGPGLVELEVRLRACTETPDKVVRWVTPRGPSGEGEGREISPCSGVCHPEAENAEGEHALLVGDGDEVFESIPFTLEWFSPGETE